MKDCSTRIDLIAEKFKEIKQNLSEKNHQINKLLRQTASQEDSLKKLNNELNESSSKLKGLEKIKHHYEGLKRNHHILVHEHSLLKAEYTDLEKESDSLKVINENLIQKYKALASMPEEPKD